MDRVRSCPPRIRSRSSFHHVSARRRDCRQCWRESHESPRIRHPQRTGRIDQARQRRQGPPPCSMETAQLQAPHSTRDGHSKRQGEFPSDRAPCTEHAWIEHAWIERGRTLSRTVSRELSRELSRTLSPTLARPPSLNADASRVSRELPAPRRRRHRPSAGASTRGSARRRRGRRSEHDAHARQVRDVVRIFVMSERIDDDRVAAQLRGSIAELRDHVAR